ncbi:hypothetical protein JAK45_08410 [Stenotrophomonas maltophilia]|nr:hypothetical protein [Stenotrophomonas maltophilia]MCU1087708.1 hypothetical protein [Stenotrophomonas maltophilia]
MHLLLVQRICQQLGTGLLQRRRRLGQIDTGAEARRRAHHERLAILHRDALQLVGRVDTVLLCMQGDIGRSLFGKHAGKLAADGVVQCVVRMRCIVERRPFGHSRCGFMTLHTPRCQGGSGVATNDAIGGQSLVEGLLQGSPSTMTSRRLSGDADHSRTVQSARRTSSTKVRIL